MKQFTSTLLGIATGLLLLSGHLYGQPNTDEVQGVNRESDAQLSRAVDERKQWLISCFNEVEDISENPKIGMPEALAKLVLSHGTDEEALDYASKVMDFTSRFDRGDAYGSIFTYPALAQFLYLFGDQLNESQTEHLKTSLTFRARDLLGHGTENHAAMRIASGYLFAQYFPDETWRDEGGNSYTSAQIMADTKKKLLERGKGFYRAGNNEVLSPTYAIVNIYPMLNLVDYAKDPEVQAAAEAMVLYHVAYLALNDFEGHLMPPYNRENVPQDRFNPTRTREYRAPTLHLLWLWFGHNQVVPEDFTISIEPAYALFLALSNWQPPTSLVRVAQGENAPYATRSSIPFFGYWGNSVPHETYRMVWRDTQFAIGTGVQRFAPDEFYLDYSMFAIAWSSANRFNYLECMHPYWRSNLGEDYWMKGKHSPFQQSFVYKNTAITLFDIPQEDPWAGVGVQQRWPEERNQHTDNLIALGQCRFPKSVDEVVKTNDWYFLREGEVYIGIRVLKPGHAYLTTLTGGGLDDFNVIKSRERKTGFVFELGSAETHTSFEAFRTALLKNKPEVDWEAMEVSYTNSYGDKIHMVQQRKPSKENPKYVWLLPEVEVNDTPFTFTDWPLMESPDILMKDSILRIGNGKNQIVVNWTGELPSITRFQE
ncbi:hypothetical protein P3T73_08720 [Kiritimatiellota bacterium B12222]|nr:hypothetical protein P3T73_08720 [Kiritimatiellota bacterium B12222]